MKAQLLIGVVTIATALAVASHVMVSKSAPAQSIPLEVHEAFKDFQAKYDRFYNSNSEYEYRLGVFHSNLQRIKEVNSGKFRYRAGVNKFADLSREEFRAKYLGVKFTTEPKNFIKADTTNDLPKHVDMRDLGAVNPIQDQKRCGSCWAFSAAAAMEASYKILGGPLVKFSEQQMVDCSSSYGNHGCAGGWMDRAYKYITDFGAELAKDYPYIANVQKCQYNKSLVEAQMTQFYDITPNTPSQLIVFAAQVTVALAVDAQGLDHYEDGIFDGYCTADLNHGVNIIGYGTSKYGTPYWLGRNCWGTDWGENGYFRIMRTMEDGPGWCGLAVAPSIVAMEKTKGN